MNPRFGAWPYIWGALYQKGKTRPTSMQFYIWMDKDAFAYGIYPSKNQQDIRDRTIRNLEKYGAQLQDYITSDFFDYFSFLTPWSLLSVSARSNTTLVVLVIAREWSGRCNLIVWKDKIASLTLAMTRQDCPGIHSYSETSSIWTLESLNPEIPLISRKDIIYLDRRPHRKGKREAHRRPDVRLRLLSGRLS